MKTVSGDASRNVRMLYIISIEVLAASGFERVYCSLGYESRDLEEVPYYHSANTRSGLMDYATFNCARTNSATLPKRG